MNDPQHSPSRFRGNPNPSRINWPVEPIKAKTLGEAERYRILREEFMSLLMQDPRVIARLEQWRTVTGLSVALEERASAGDAASYRTADRHLEAACQRWEMLADEVVAFLCNDLDVPWTWVGSALLKAVVDGALAGTSDDEILLPETLTLVIADPLAPDFRMKSFQMKAGETESEILQRFDEHVNDERARLLASCQVQGRVESRSMPGKQLPLYAQWLYRHRVCKESIRSIAVSYHEAASHPRDFKSYDCRKAVYYGVEQAERVLIPAE